MPDTKDIAAPRNRPVTKTFTVAEPFSFRPAPGLNKVFAGDKVSLTPDEHKKVKYMLVPKKKKKKVASE